MSPVLADQRPSQDHWRQDATSSRSWSVNLGRTVWAFGIIVGLAEWVTALAVYTLTQPLSHADGLHDFLNPWLAMFVSGTGIAVVFALVGGAVSSARGRIETLR
jgi:hypothetical protein